MSSEEEDSFGQFDLHQQVRLIEAKRRLNAAGQLRKRRAKTDPARENFPSPTGISGPAQFEYRLRKLIRKIKNNQ